MMRAFRMTDPWISMDVYDLEFIMRIQSAMVSSTE